MLAWLSLHRHRESAVTLSACPIETLWAVQQIVASAVALLARRRCKASIIAFENETTATVPADRSTVAIAVALSCCGDGTS